MRTGTTTAKLATLTLIAVTATASFLSSAMAAGGHEPPSFPSLYPTKPAKSYSGSTPIDLSNGLKGNNGTYGNPNPDYESWAAAPAVVAGLSEQSYSYKQRGEFVRTLNEQVAWGEAALANWKNTSSITRAEAVEYSKAATEKMKPLVEKLKSATDKADGAGEKEWTNAESEARRALIDMRTAYTQLHHNTQWHSSRPTTQQ